MYVCYLNTNTMASFYHMSLSHRKTMLLSITSSTGVDQGVTISVHGHDDLGMAVANFMAAIEGGARQVGSLVG